MDTQEFYELSRSLQEELFPHLELDEDKAKLNGKWDFAMPSYHFKPPYPLITKQIIQDLKDNDKKLLDAGCGPAYLEQLLVSKLGIKSEQILLADISDKFVPEGFRFICFDMFKEWPILEDSFDYVILPGYPFKEPYAEWDLMEIGERMYGVFGNALNVLNSHGQIRMNCSLGYGPRDYVKERIESPNIEMVNEGQLTCIKRR